MAKVPCENIIWHILPAIRKEFAKNLMKNYGLNQRQIAEILEISPAAVCQYFSNKRGGINIEDVEILNEIDNSARIIFENGSTKLIDETCRICKLFKSKENINGIDYVIR